MSTDAPSPVEPTPPEGGPYRTPPQSSSEPRRARRWPWLVGVTLVLAAPLVAVLALRPRHHEPLAASVIPTELWSTSTTFGEAEDELPVATPLAPLLASSEPEALALLEPSEGVTRVTRGNVLVVRFSRPMARATEVGRAADPLPFRLETEGGTPIEGAGVWASRSTLHFAPTERSFDRNAVARLVPTDRATSIEGEPWLDDGLERTIALDGTPCARGADEQVRVGAPLGLYFDAPVSAATLAGRLLVYESGGGSRSIPVSVRAGTRNDDRYRVELMPRRPLEPGSSVAVALAPAFSPWGGDQPVIYSFAVQPRPRFVGVGCTISDFGTAGCVYSESPGQVIDIDSDLILLASEALAAAPPGSVRVSPSVAGLRVAVEGLAAERARHLVVRAEWEPDQVYEVRFGSFTTETGQRVLPTGALAIRSRGRASEVVLAGGTRTFETGARRSVAFRAVNVAAGVARVRAIEPGEEAQALLHPQAFVLAGEAQRSLQALAPSSRANRWGTGTIEVPPFAVVGLGATDSRMPYDVRTAIVQQTDLAISAVASRDELLVWVTRVHDATPVADAEVVTWGGRGERRGTSTTDADGLARFEGAAASGVLEGHTIVAARRGDERAFLDFDPNAGAGPAQLGASMEGSSSGTLRATVVTDRGAYRPGERLRAVAILRDVRGGDVTAISPRPVSVRVWDPSSQLPFAVRDATTDELGVVDVSLALPDPAPIGTWRVDVVPRVAIGGEPSIGEATFELREFREPTLRVDVADLPALAVRETLQLEVDGRYLFGAPVEHGALTWQVRRVGPSSVPHSYADFLFGSRNDVGAVPVLGEGTTELTDAGHVALPVALPASLTRRTHYAAELTLTDPSGASVTTERAFDVMPGEFEIGMRDGADWQGLGDTLRAEVVALDATGELVEGAELELTLVREGWHGWWEWHEAGEDAAVPSLALRRVARAERVASCRVTTGAEVSVCEHRPSRTGTYRWIARAVQAARSTAVAERLVYVAGPDESPDRDPPGAPIALTPERESYAAGESARLAFECPWPEGEALVTVTTAGAHRTVRQRVGAGGQVIELPIDATMVPNAHVALVLVRPRTGDPTATSDLNAPDVRYGVAELHVRPSIDPLSVTVEIPNVVRDASDLPTLRTGSSNDVSVRVVDASGAPVADAEVVLWAVDEGTLRMTSYRVPDATAGFFVSRPAMFALDDLRRTLVSRLPQALEGLPSGDGGFESDAGTLVSRERYEPTIVWAPRLRTDGEGRAHASLDVPERTTEYRVMALAIDASSRAGRSSTTVVATRPLVVRPMLPRFATEGDAFDVRVALHNRTDHPTHVDVVVRAGDRVVATTAVDVPARHEGQTAARVEVPQLADDVTSLPLTIEASSPDDRVSLARTLPVVPRGRVVRQTMLVGGVAERTLDLALPEGVRRVQLSVHTGTHPFIDASAQLARMMDAPWHSTEDDALFVLGALAVRELSGPPSDAREVLAGDQALERAVRRLLAAQMPTGGFAPYLGGELEDVRGTVLAAFTLARLASTDVDVPLRARQVALDRVAQIVANGEIYGGGEDGAWLALALRVLVDGGRDVSSARSDAFSRRLYASPRELAWLALAYPEGSEERATLVRSAIDRAIPKPDRAAQSFASTAIVVDAAATVGDPARRPELRALVTEVVRRAPEAAPPERGWALMAWASLARGLAPGPATSIALDGHPLDVVRHDGLGRSADTTLSTSSVVGGAHQLLARSARDVPVFLAVEGSWIEPLTNADRVARGRAFALHRRLETEAGEELEDGAHVPVGSLVRVRLFVHTESAYSGPVAVRDPHAAGLEPIDPALSASPVTALRSLLGMGPADDAADARGELALASIPAIQTVEHDVHASTFALRGIDGGLLELTYGVRATTPGTFTLAPAALVAAGRADLEARSGFATLTVDP